MTFYHVLYAIVFVGALRVFCAALGTPLEQFHFTACMLAESFTLVVLILCDMIFTADILEERKRPYRRKLKLWDGLSFFILLVALAIAAGQDNKLEILEKPFSLFGWTPDARFFWICIVLYFWSLQCWNKEAKTYELAALREYKSQCQQWQCGMALGAFGVFVVQIAGSFLQCEVYSVCAKALSVAYAAAAVVYFYHKIFGVMRLLEEGEESQKKQKVMELRTLLPADETKIHGWPAYKGYYARLDYALRSGSDGWLIHYADSHKFGGYVENELKGFTLLVENGAAEASGRRAEFYVAVNPDETGAQKGYGTELCAKTLEHGFKFLQLDEIWLKVRVDHEWGMKNYPKMEFVIEGEPFAEAVNGQTVSFFKMSIKKADYVKRASSGNGSPGI